MKKNESPLLVIVEDDPGAVQMLKIFIHDFYREHESDTRFFDNFQEIMTFIEEFGLNIGVAFLDNVIFESKSSGSLIEAGAIVAQKMHETNPRTCVVRTSQKEFSGADEAIIKPMAAQEVDFLLHEKLRWDARLN